MHRLEWVSSSSGLRGSPYLVQQAEQEIASHLAAIDEGLPLDERPNPLITALLLTELLSGLHPRVADWWQRRYQAHGTDPLRI